MPHLFQLAELENSRAGKLGMEIGSARERIIIALLMYRFGEENVEIGIPITGSEIDVLLFSNPISIKTATSKKPTSFKLIWTVDRRKALEFKKKYQPAVDMIYAQIFWGGIGYLYYFPKESQLRVFKKIGRKKYIRLPKQGTNPRGVEITKEALVLLAKDKQVLKIEINWERGVDNFKVYDRWVELWGVD